MLNFGEVPACVIVGLFASKYTNNALMPVARELDFLPRYA